MRSSGSPGYFSVAQAPPALAAEMIQPFEPPKSFAEASQRLFASGSSCCCPAFRQRLYTTLAGCPLALLRHGTIPLRLRQLTRWCAGDPTNPRWNGVASNGLDDHLTRGLGVPTGPTVRRHLPGSSAMWSSERLPEEGLAMPILARIPLFNHMALCLAVVNVRAR